MSFPPGPTWVVDDAVQRQLCRAFVLEDDRRHHDIGRDELDWRRARKTYTIKRPIFDGEELGAF